MTSLRIMIVFCFWISAFTALAEEQRDPFRSFVQPKTPPSVVIDNPDQQERSFGPKSISTPDPAPRQTVLQHKRAPLELFELDALLLVAIVQRRTDRIALVQDPLGKGHTVRVGSRMGRHEGRVTVIDIEKNQLSILESLLGDRLRVMKLQPSSDHQEISP